MEKFVKQWLLEPLVIKIIIAILGIVAIRIIMGTLRRSLPRYVTDAQAKYRVRKLITYGSYVLVALLLAIVFRDKLGGLTVVLGLAGAGVALALQDVL